MADIDWDAFNEGLTGKDIRTLEKMGSEDTGDNEYYEVPDGSYEVRVTSIRLGVSKSGKQGAYFNFEVINGEESGEDIFYYMGLDGEKRAYKLKLVVDMLGKLKSGVDFSYKNFKTEDGKLDGAKLEDAIEEAVELIDANGIEYGLKKGKNKGGYTTIEITDVFD